MRFILGPAALLIVIAPLGTPAHAQSTLDTLPSYEEAYAALAADPGNVDLLFGIARRAELEAERDPASADSLLQRAVRHYERILLVNPDLSQVALRLGEIQYHLGRLAEAEARFERALADPTLPPDIRAETEGYLAAIREEIDPSGISGSLFAGLRHQTNATAAPAEDFPTIPDFVTEDPGTDAFFVLRLIHSYDPGWQRRHTLETRLDLDGSHYLDQDDLDTNSAELSFGPRLDLSSYGVGGTSIRPHLIGGVLAIDGALFTSEIGLGAEADARVTPDLWGFALLRAVSQRFNETLGNPDLDDRDGWEYTARIATEYRLTPAFALGGAVETILKGAEVETEEYRRLGAELTASLALGSPAGPRAGNWVTRLSLGWSEDRYETDPGVPRRRDDYLWARLASSLPVAPSVSLAGSLGYTDRQSSLSQFEYDNFEVALGIAYRF